ncbi:MAG: serine/threonine-protein kinase, partial [Planctomycetota bacterium]
MSARQEDFVYAEHVLRRGFATEEQVQECLELLSRVRTEMELDETLEGVLLKKGYLAPAQAAVINQTINPEEAGRSRNQIEGYRLLARLGSGAMGSVYKARHVKLDILVALKVLRVELAKSRTQVERLKREAQLAARLSHENIVRSLDVGESNGFHYFAMEFVDGPTARSLIRETRMKEKDALKIVLNVARGLEHAHAAGVIHRDVKPANIMLSKDGRVKLGDFGLARGQGPSELTLEHAAIGTPQYLAPEQAASAANATPRSDLYSLGATLYHLVTGQPPFSGENLAEIFGKVLRSEFEPPEAVVDDLSVDTLYLIHRLMRPNPKDRYANATELIVDLEKSLNGQRIAPSDFKGDYQSFLDARKRKRGAIAAAAMVVILLSAWFTLSTIAKSRERQEQLETCRVLNDRGDGELDALSTLAELEAKRAELVGARAEGDACDEGLLADLDKRIGLLGIDLERVRIADDVLARARANEPNYRVLLGEAEPIRPVLRGAAQRCEYVRNEIRRISDRAAHDAYRAVYTERAYESVDAAIEA